MYFFTRIQHRVARQNFIKLCIIILSLREVRANMRCLARDRVKEPNCVLNCILSWVECEKRKNLNYLRFGCHFFEICDLNF